MLKSLALAVALAVGSSSVALAAGAAPAVEPAAQTFHFGGLAVTALRDQVRTVPNDGKVFGSQVGTQAAADVLAAAGAPTDGITLGFGALLVKDGKHTVLIDTGLGPKAQGRLVPSLVKAGYRPAQITGVLITHVHGDHIGGLLTAEGTPAFAKASVRISAPDWAWLQGQPQMAELVKAITPQVKTFAPGDSVAPNIRSVPLKGHTPGHVGYQIGSGPSALLDVDDLVHSAIISLAKPGWLITFDTDSDAAIATRRAELAKLAASHETIFAPHFPFPGIGTIQADGDHFVWQPAR
ncbi:MAG: Ribonuclease BN [Stenotrophomonas maltophilia]|nr:MAG: Ribonuclease BN [Stenotrophomonas maltophilia]